MSAENTGFRSWAIVELMGHVTLAGLVTETEIGGGKLMRIDVPESVGMAAFSSLFGTASIYKLTPVTEDVVRQLCGRRQQQPFIAWDLQQAFNAWAREKKDALKEQIREEVRRELTHQPGGETLAGDDEEHEYPDDDFIGECDQ